MSVVGELTVSIVGDMSKLSSVFSKASTEAGNFGNKMSSIGQTMSTTGSAMTAGVTVPLAAVGAGIGATMAKASEFDTGMRRVSTMLPGITKQGFDELSNQALDLSKTYGSSTAEMTDAMYQALSSGVPKENIFTFMQDAEKLAIGGASDVVSTTDVLTNAVNSYGAANLSTAKASDILFQGTKFGKSTVEELAHELSGVMPIAASVGVGFDDLNASLATMTIQGTPTSEAVTQLRGMLDALSTPTDSAAQAFEYLSGQSFPEFMAAGHNMGDVIQVLNDNIGKQIPESSKLAKITKELSKPTSDLAIQFQKVAGMSYEQFQTTGGELIPILDKMGVTYGKTTTRVSDYFGRIEAGTGALQLSAQNNEIYKSSLEGMGQAAGSTDEAFKTMSEGSGAALDRLKTSFEVLSIKMGDAFLPLLADTLVPAMGTLVTVIDKAVPVITLIAKAFGALPASIQLGILAFTAFVAALGPVLMIAGSIASGIGAIAALFGAGGALAGAGTVIAGLVAGLSSLALPIVAVIAGLVLLYEAWTNNWLGIQDTANRVWNYLKTALPNVVTSFGTAYNKIISQGDTLKQQFGNAWNSIINLFSSIKTGLVSGVTSLYSGLQARYTQIITGVQGLLVSWQNHWNNIKTATSSAATGLSSALGVMYNYIQAKFTQIKAAAQGILASWVAHWNNFRSTTSAAGSALNAALAAMYSYVQAKFNQIKTAAQGILTVWRTHWNNFVSATRTGASNIASALSSMLSNIQSRFSAILSAISTLISNWKSRLTDMVSATRSKAGDIANAVGEIATKVKNKASEFYNAGKEVVQKLIDGLTSKLSDVKKKVSEILNAASVSSSNSLGKSLSTSISNAGKSAKVTLTEAATGLKRLLPNSPAKEGPFQTLPNWDAIFYTPLSQSIDRINTLSAPLTTALNSIKNPVDLDISNGVKSISNVTTSNSYSYGGDTLSLGGVTLANNLDVNALFDAWEKRIANKRRARGI